MNNLDAYRLRFVPIACCLSVALVSVGCARSSDYNRGADWGESVSHMKSVQAITLTTEEKTLSVRNQMDATKGSNLLEEYRKDVAKPIEVKEDIVIKVGSGI